MSSENPADTVIEQAARRLAWAMADADGIHPGDFETDPFDDLTDDAQRDVLAFARALHDAGLLADPADRDVKARLIAHRNVLRRMNRAEAEVARLHSWEGLLELLDDHWPEDIFPTLPDDQSRDPGPRIVSLIRWVADLRATVERLRAQVAAVRALADEWERALSDTLRVEIDELRAALDGEGEQHE